MPWRTSPQIRPSRYRTCRARRGGRHGKAKRVNPPDGSFSRFGSCVTGSAEQREAEACVRSYPGAGSGAIRHPFRYDAGAKSGQLGRRSGRRAGSARIRAVGTLGGDAAPAAYLLRYLRYRDRPKSRIRTPPLRLKKEFSAASCAGDTSPRRRRRSSSSRDRCFSAARSAKDFILLATSVPTCTVSTVFSLGQERHDRQACLPDFPIVTAGTTENC